MHFNHQDAINYAKMLVCHDEVERALWVLNNVPGHARANPIKEVEELKTHILSRIFTAHDYVFGDDDSNVSLEGANWTIENLLRGRLIAQEVIRLNDKGLIPHIVDMGPGDYFVPIGLNSKGLQFTYKEISLNKKAKELAMKLLPEHIFTVFPSDSSPVIFLANEVIEHLPHVEDIAIELHKHCPVAPVAIHLSTPYCTFDIKKTFEEIQKMPHLRTYTPSEFVQTVSLMFPSYALQLYPSDVMSIRCVSKNHPGFGDPLTV